MAKKDESTAIDKAPQAGAVVERDPADASTYRILNRTEEELNRTMDVFHHNLRGQKLTELNLPRVKVPPPGDDHLDHTRGRGRHPRRGGHRHLGGVHHPPGLLGKAP